MVVFHRVSHVLFKQSIDVAKQADTKNGAFVHAYTEDEYRTMQCFLGPHNELGYAIKDGDIVSVFKHPESTTKQAMFHIMNDAISRGGYKLDCFDGFLPVQYKKYGFIEYDRAQWMDEYAPKDWNYELHERPDVVFMALEGSQQLYA